MASSEENIDFMKLLYWKQSSVANPVTVGGGISGMDTPSKFLRFFYIPALKKMFAQPSPLHQPEKKNWPVSKKFEPPPPLEKLPG